MPFDEFATYREIKSQTQAWAQALEMSRQARLPAAEHYDQVIFTGCGSTFYLSLAAAALYQQLTGRIARAIPAGELLLNSDTILTKQKILLIAISRSGTTTETIKAVEKFKAGKYGEVLVISNYAETLSRLADASIMIPAGQEESVAQTRSFASMYVAACAIAVRMAGRQDLLEHMTVLPEIGIRMMENFEAVARQIGENLDYNSFYFLGSGIRYGLACETNLKMKEMTLTHSEPFHFLEFRHGPMSMVNENTMVIGLVSESNFEHESKVLKEMSVLGGRIVSLGESNVDIPFQSGIPEIVRGVLYLPVLQLMGFYRALVKGLNPDRPTNLVSVIKLDL